MKMTASPRLFRIVSLGFLSAMLLTGCSDEGSRELVNISGTVTFDGEPLEEGAIEFHPAAGTTEGAVIENGKYTATISPGTNRVKITASTEHPTRKMPNVEPDKPDVPEMVELIPAQYNENTTLSIEAKNGGTHDFDLKSEPDTGP